MKVTAGHTAATAPTVDAPAAVTRDERRSAVPELYDAGLTTREIGARFGVSHRTIVNDLAALEIVARPARRLAAGGLEAAERRRRVSEMYATMTCAEIADELGCSDQTIKRDVRDLGLRPRPAAPRRRHPEPLPRPCLFCGVDFTPTAHQVVQGYGKWCSDDCYRAARTFDVDVRAIEAAVAYANGATWGEVGAVHAVNRVTVWRDLRRVDATLRGRLRRAGSIVTCGCGCGRSRWVYRSQPTRFLGCDHWARSRASADYWLSLKGLVSSAWDAWPGRTRRKWKNRFNSTLERARRYSPQQEQRALELLCDGASIRKIAYICGLSKHQVEGIKGRATQRAEVSP
jgi:transposase